VLENAHKLGAHHVAVSVNGARAVSAGFGGDVKIWKSEDGTWNEQGNIAHEDKAGEVWAVALSADGRYVAATTYDGRVNVWDVEDEAKKITGWETKGSFGMSIDLVWRHSGSREHVELTRAVS